ncbi:hypothetical protein Trydic_g11661 [Trypoxylus dichotomus]
MGGIRGSLQSLKLFNIHNKIQQFVFGTAAGVATGYLAVKVGRPLAFIVGGGIILFQGAQNHGITKMSWKDASRKTQPLTNPLARTLCRWKCKAKYYAKTNTCFTACFVGGFLIGAACVE